MADPTVDAIALERFIPYLLFRVSRRLNAHLREEMRSAGVTIHRWRVLAVLAARDGRSLAELAAETVMEQSVISRVVDQMRRDGLVRREAGKADRRVGRILLTGRGRALFARIFPVARMHQRRATRDLTADEGRTLVRLLGKVLHTINAEEAR
jgi:MarR family transcriptional regulator, organic hydroperoxide resistance regulator